MESFKKIIRLKRLWMLLLTPIAYLMLVIAKHNSFFAEYVFARVIFKVYSQILSFVTGLLPISLAELGIVFSPLLLAGLLAWRITVLVKKKGMRLYLVIRDLLTLVCIASLVGFMLIWGCTINYHRYTFAQNAGLVVRDSSADELYDLCMELVEKTNTVRAKLTNEGEDGSFVLSESMYSLAGKCQKAYKELAKDYSFMGGVYPRTKSVIHSTFMSKTEFTGMYVPFTMEANVNVDVPHYSIASTMCHELAHLRGFIREDEANYISYLACMASGDPVLEYSGLMEALIHSGNALAGKNMDKYVEVRRACSDAVNRDFAANSAYWKQFENTVISNTADAVNDAYLVANGEKDGVQSYGRMVDYMLAEYRKNHGIN